VGFDPCLVAKEDYMFSEYSEVSVEFQLEDINGNLLPLDLCQVHKCGVRLLYEDEIHCIDYYHDPLEAMFQCKRASLQGKRARFQGMSWEDYSVMCRTYEFLVRFLLDFQLYSGELYRMFLFFSICHVSF
jgi:hypothetical protein